MDMSAAGMCRAKDDSRDIVSCAVLAVFPPGVFMTMMPSLQTTTDKSERVRQTDSERH